ncbi:unnamed protein product [Musa hybrid cultivar]
MNFSSVSCMTDSRLCPSSSNLFRLRKFKTSYRGLSLFSKLQVRITGQRMIDFSSKPTFFIRKVILSHMVFFENVQTYGHFLNTATMSGWEHPKLIRVALVASKLDLFLLMTT